MSPGAVCVCVCGKRGEVFVCPSIYCESRHRQRRLWSRPVSLSAELINRLRLRTCVFMCVGVCVSVCTCVGVCHRPTSLFGCVCFRHQERVFINACPCFISSLAFLLNCFSPCLSSCSPRRCQKSGTRLCHRLLSRFLKCVRFQAVAGMVRDRGSSA